MRIDSVRNSVRLGVTAVLAFSLVGSAAAHEGTDAIERHYETAGTCINCPGRSRFHWDAQYVDWRGDTRREASIYQGTAGNVYTCMQLRVGNQVVNADSSVSEYADRGFSTEPVVVDDVNVTRDVFFPSDGLDFGRWIDSFANIGDVAVDDLRVEYFCTYNGCVPAGCTTSSYDGDNLSEARDRWIVWNDSDRGDYAAVGVVTHGVEAPLAPASLRFDEWKSFSIVFLLDIPPGGTSRLLTFMVQANDTDAAASAADYLMSLPPEATVGLPETIPAFANFATDGRPSVRLGGPYIVPEGGDRILEPIIFDREDDQLVVSWDFDCDGVFDDAFGPNPAFSAIGLDGPGEACIALRVEEGRLGGHVVERRGYISLLNVAPVIVSAPPPAARVGRRYEYTPDIRDAIPRVTEPCRAWLEDGHPENMSLHSETGVLNWTPTPAQVGEHEVLLHVVDDDQGETEQRIKISVLPNAPPTVPLPLMPNGDSCTRRLERTFTAGTSSDPDGDSVGYEFELDSEPTFDGIVHRQISPAGRPLAEGPSGLTVWTAPRRLLPGVNYYWRVRATDGMAASEWAVEHFWTCEDENGRDGGPVVGVIESGCTCSSAGFDGAPARSTPVAAPS